MSQKRDRRPATVVLHGLSEVRVMGGEDSSLAVEFRPEPDLATDLQWALMHCLGIDSRHDRLITGLLQPKVLDQLASTDLVKQILSEAT